MAAASSGEHDEQNELEGQFASACGHVGAVAGQLPADALLYLYARYKQATEGQCRTSRPWLDFAGRRKWDAWRAMGDAPAEQAKREYVEHVASLDCGWRRDQPASGPTGGGFGVRPSVMARDGDDSADDDDEWFAAVKRGDAAAVRSLMAREALGRTDANGMSALHWAADRGHADVVSLLIGGGAQVDGRDSDGQSALHYAAACSHADIVRLLVRATASPAAVDNDGATPADLADSLDIRQLLNSQC